MAFSALMSPISQGFKTCVVFGGRNVLRFKSAILLRAKQNTANNHSKVSLKPLEPFTNRNKAEWWTVRQNRRSTNLSDTFL